MSRTRSALSPTDEDDARRLLSCLDAVVAGGSPAFALCVHLSRIPLVERKPAVRLFTLQDVSALAGRLGAKLFVLPGGDIVLIAEAIEADQAEAAAGHLRALLGTCPSTDLCPSPAGDDVVSWYDLADPADAAAVEALAGPRPRPALIAVARRPVGPTDVAGLCDRVRSRGIADLIRQQTVLRVAGSRDRMTPVFRETFVSIPDLQEKLAPKLDIFAHPSLFRFLTEALDRSVLAHLSSRSDPDAGAVSLNLNLSTLRSPEFAAFCTARGDEETLVEVQLVDAMADAEAFETARADLRRRGFRLVLDGVRLRDLAHVDLRGLSAAYVKLLWNEAADAGMPAARSAALRRGIERIGQARCVLARVESEEALAWAVGSGIECLQGHYIDRLVRALGHPAAG